MACDSSPQPVLANLYLCAMDNVVLTIIHVLLGFSLHLAMKHQSFANDECYQD
jgi:hypothetical protein